MTRAPWIILALLPLATVARADKPWPKRALEAARQYEAGEFTPAVEGYEAVIADGDARPELSYNLGNALYRAAAGDSAAIAAAGEAYARAAASAGEALGPRSTYNAANVAATLGDLAAAEALYRDVLRRNPDDEDARFNLEWVQRQLAGQPPSPSDSGDETDGESEDSEQDQPEKQNPADGEGAPDESSGNEEGSPPETPPDEPPPSEESGSEEPPPGSDSDGTPDAPPEDQGQGTPPELTESDAPPESSPQVSAEQARRELDKLEEVERELLRQLLHAKRRRVDVEKDW